QLLGFARWLGLKTVDAQDVVHDVFLEIWHHAGDFDPSRGSVQTWIYFRLRSRIMDHYRRVTRQRVAASTPHDGTPRINDEQWNHDSRLYLKGRLATLPENQQQVLVLSFLEGFSHGEIARRLSIPFGTVKSRLARALATLRDERED
ncbi:MAG: sigma-70 family RNA polymerase sigma factor, partial [Polyangiaceae bacterium]